MEAVEETAELIKQYNAFTDQLESVRKQKIDLLNNADLPLPGLSVQGGELTYLGQKWDNMSVSDQLKVSTAILPQCNHERRTDDY